MANEFKVKKGLIVHGSGSTVLDIQGSQGQLFSITDDLTGTLFAVSDISGVPIFDVNADGTTTLDGNLNLGDNNKLQLGASQDLQIYHDGSNSYISELGTGDLIISADNDLTFKDGSGNIMANMNASNSVELMFGNVKKFETTNTGVEVTGDLVINGNIKNDIENGSLDLYGGADATNDAHIKLYGNNSQWASIVMDHGYDAANSKFIVNQGGTERFKIQNNIAYFSGRVSADTHYQSSDTNVTLSATGTGNVYLRPNGYSTTTGQVHIDTSGNATFGNGITLKQTAGNSLIESSTSSMFLKASNVQIQGNLIPDADSSRNLGASNRYWENLYADNLYGDGSNLTNVTATSFTETDTLDSVTGRGATTTNNISVGKVTIGHSAFTAISLTRNSTNGSNIDFNNSGGILGRIGFLGDGTLAVTNSTIGTSNMFSVSASGFANFASTVKSTSGVLALGADVTLFRDGANILRTDDAFHANSNIYVGGDGKLYDRANNANYIELADTVNISTDTSIAGTTTTTKVNINQAADEQGLEIKGYDDHSSSEIKLQINSSGHARLSQTTDGSSGYLFLQAENYLQLIAGTFTYTTNTFRVYDNTEMQFGSSGDYKISHKTSGDKLIIHTDDNKGITIDNAGNVTFTEDVTVAGKVTAQEFHTEFVSASIMYDSGSTQFGDSADDTHTFTGTLTLAGPTGNATMTTTAAGDLTIDADDDIRLDAGGGDVVLRTSGTEYGRISAFSNALRLASSIANEDILLMPNGTGNVGIGTTNPGYKLTVTGDAGFSDWIYASKFYPTSSTTDILMQTGAGRTITLDPTSTGKVLIPNGKVGIGLTNPSEKLDIDGTLKVRGNIVGAEATTLIKDVITDQSYEGQAYYNPETLNAFAGAHHWATITVTNAKESNRTTALTDLGGNPFRVGGNTAQIYFDTSETEIVIEIDHTAEPLKYHGVVGMQFTNTGWRPERVKIEGYNGTTWTTGLDTTTNSDTTVAAKIGLGGAGIQKTKFTLGNPANSSGGYMRISKIFGYDYKGVSSHDAVKSGTYYVNRYDDSAHYSTIYPATDSTYNLGTSTLKYANIYADNLYGDGSNITNISATDSTKLPLAGGIMNTDATINMSSGQLTSVDYIDFGIGQLNGVSTSNFILKSLGDITYNVDSNDNGDSAHIFQESGNELMRIRYDGKVGIGESSPAARLHVVEDTQFASGQASVEVLKLQRKNTGGDIKATTEGHISMWATDSNNDTEWGRISWVNDNAADGGLENEGAMSFWTSKEGTLTRAMYINHDQEIGIGTTTPDASLKIVDASDSSTTSLSLNDRIKFRGDGVMSWGSAAGHGQLNWSGNYALISGLTGKGLKFNVGSSSLALTLDTNLDATFAGDITLGANHIGRDADNYVGFETDNQIKFRVNGATQVKLIDGALNPQTDSDIDLGTNTVRYKNIYADNIYGAAQDLAVSANDTFSGTYSLLWHDGADVYSSSWLTVTGATDTLNVPNITTTGDVDVSGSFGVEQSFTAEAGGDVVVIGGFEAQSGIEVTGNSEITGDLTVTGKVTAQEFHTEFVSASIMYESGSTKFGDTSDDVHNFTGSVNIDGTLSATVKSFDIDHPTIQGKRLVYGVLEGPEHAVYVRGESKEDTVILPEEWEGLVDKGTLTVQLTPIGSPDIYYYKNYENNSIIVGGPENKHYFYYVQATRKDVEPLITVQ